MSLSSQMLKSPLAFSAALYAFQFVVRYLRRPQFVSLIIRAYYRCGPDLCNKASLHRQEKSFFVASSELISISATPEISIFR